MVERPIIMSARDVCAILDGRMTQMRRVIKPQPDEERFSGMVDGRRLARFWSPGEYKHTSTITDIRCPYGVSGDRLWVREAWQTTKFFRYSNGTSPVAYRATDVVDKNIGPYGSLWRSPVFMPRWASRITLEIVDVWVERVQQISMDDILAEGIIEEKCIVDVGGAGGVHYEMWEIRSWNGTEADDFPGHEFAEDAFIELWNSSNEKQGYGWETNPWVWVIEFTGENK